MNREDLSHSEQLVVFRSGMQARSFIVGGVNQVLPSPQASLASLTVSVAKLGLGTQEVGIPSRSLKT